MTTLLRASPIDGTPQRVDVNVVGGRGYATLDFGAGETDAQVIVWDASVLSTSVIMAQLAAAVTPEHPVEDHLAEELDVFASAPYAGLGFIIYGRTRNVPLYGRFVVSYLWS